MTKFEKHTIIRNRGRPRDATTNEQERATTRGTEDSRQKLGLYRSARDDTIRDENARPAYTRDNNATWRVVVHASLFLERPSIELENSKSLDAGPQREGELKAQPLWVN